MGTWGPKLYQDDVAEEVRDYYKDQLRKGKKGKEITQDLVKQNEETLSDSDDAPIFWFALADTQWSLGRLEDFVKEKALYYIREGSDMKRWETDGPKNAEIRKKVLSELEQKLLLPQPPKKKIVQYHLYKCGWKVGDVFAYRLESNYANEKGIDGCYLLIQKVDEYIFHPGHVIPIVYVKITKHDKLPTNAKEYNSLEYVQTSFRRFNPFFEKFSH